MGIGDKLKKARSLGIAGTVKMAAVKWKKAERSDGSPAAGKVEEGGALGREPCSAGTQSDSGQDPEQRIQKDHYI